MRWLHGEGGQGKTRLAAALAADAERPGWLVVDAVHRMETHPTQAGSQDMRVTEHAGVLLVDYADRWSVSDLGWLFQNQLLHQPFPTRVLLLARSASGWPALQAKLHVWLSRLGRYEEALSATEEAIAAHRKLADTNTPDLPALAAAIHNRAVELFNLGRREEALKAAEETVMIHRTQAEADAADLPALAVALHNYSVDLSDLGREDESLSVAEEAITIYRALAKDNPERHLTELAVFLEHLSERWASRGRHEEALSIAQEAGTVCRRLVKTNPVAHLLENARVTGTGAGGALRLQNAHITGLLDLSSAEITNLDEESAILNLQDAQVEGLLLFPASLVCADPPRRTTCPRSHRVQLDGFTTFGGFHQISWLQWLHLIRRHTFTYRPGPYQQLAAAERTAGHDGNARRILIAQQQDLYQRNRSAIGGWPAQVFHRLWGALAGYGYQARRTTAALLVALAAATGLGLWAGQVSTGNGHHAAERTESFTNQTGAPCAPVELIGVGLDRGLPLSPTGIRTRCDLNTNSAAGQWFTGAVWLVQAAVWSLATLALAGYIGLVRKPT